MIVYDCNSILTAPTKIISDKESPCAFTDLETDLKPRGFNPRYHIMNNKASTTFKNKIKTTEVNYQLVIHRHPHINNT